VGYKSLSASVTTCHMTIVLPGIGPICEHGTFEHVLRPSSSFFPRQTLMRPPVHHMYIILLVSYVEQSTFSFISSSIRQSLYLPLFDDGLIALATVNNLLCSLETFRLRLYTIFLVIWRPCACDYTQSSLLIQSFDCFTNRLCDHKYNA